MTWRSLVDPSTAVKVQCKLDPCEKTFEEQQTDSVCVRITEPDTVGKGGISSCSGWKLSGSAVHIGTMATSQMQIHQAFRYLESFTVLEWHFILVLYLFTVHE